VQAGPGMKRMGHKRVPSLRRRGLPITAATDGGNEAILAAHDIPAGCLWCWPGVRHQLGRVFESTLRSCSSRCSEGSGDMDLEGAGAAAKHDPAPRFIVGRIAPLSANFIGWRTDRGQMKASTALWVSA
jgi:hypothetical protein